MQSNVLELIAAAKEGKTEEISRHIDQGTNIEGTDKVRNVPGVNVV